MINGVTLVLLLIGLVASSANRLYDNIDDDPEGQRKIDFDRLAFLRKYILANTENRRNVYDAFETWNGRWMPDRPGDPLPPPKIFPKTDSQYMDRSSQFHHLVPMGHPSKDCDDAKTNLTMDWDRSPVNYTCYDRKIVPSVDRLPLKYCEHIPKSYMALHHCMYQRIEYDNDIPIFGAHRPLWPVYGEYKFLPKQRWLHSLEHGAIVMLYHPCANPLEVQRLRHLVTGCLRRHVISPYNLLPQDRPLALVSWGCRLTMSYVNPEIVTRFIREHALQGPEEIAKDGDFDDGLLSSAETVSDEDDTTLCPDSRQF